jgi:uncharacterized protein (TIGR00725 family)
MIENCYHNLMPDTLKFKIAISGAADTEFMNADTLPEVELLGRLIAERGMVTVTGATTGAPYWAAKGAKEAGGIVIGISPAATKAEHIKVYGLPVEYHDLIIYTGFGYSGRNLLFTRSADAVITVAGRIGTLNEFTDAFEDQKPQGVLLGLGGTTDDIKKMLEDAHRGMGKVVFDTDPKALLDKVVAMLQEEEKELGIE